MHEVLNRRFLQSTRGQVVIQLRRGPRTVDQLAQALGLTDNGVRVHLTTLERDGVVRQGGVRRTEGAGKPATVYELTPEAEGMFSRAYAPVLGAVLEELVAQLPPERSAAVLEAVGRRLAATVMPPPGAKFEARVDTAVAIMTGLGGAVELEESEGMLLIRGCACPLSSAVSRRPETCQVVESLLSEVIGTRVRQCCRHGDRPSCCFRVPPAA
jgi:predicted ArsR family transcriptional regulator